ncbi:pyridoxal phosphate-dependent decarboxylase family protein [Parafilimonas sp.]|uniref:pyridoxal phosphate-dependent decarboxylase family protein n=1 Tax=Parafilimonas sp. TaxID=1969739 RepID=UPI0039E41FD4
MNIQLQNDLSQLDTLLEKIKEQGIAYLNNISSRPTSAKKEINTVSALPGEGIGTLETLKQFNARFEPIMVASSGPRFWGFVTGGSTPASIVGDWLTSVYDPNPQTIKGRNDISAAIEFETIQLLLELFNLPADFSGGFVTGATTSNFTCLAVARQWIGKQLGKDFAKDSITERINVFSAAPHSSVIKSLSLLGIGSNNLIKIKTEEGNRESISMEDLEKKITELTYQPFILVSSGGTVNTVDFDDFIAITALKEKYNFWWHIDAAFGGFAACSPKYKHLLQGWENADSITVDCHKWLNVPYESAVFFVKQQHSLLQVETFQNSNAPYLGNPFDNFSYMNFLPENSRRLRALPAWFSLNAYGKNGYREIVENCIACAQHLGQFIESSPHFKLLAPVRLNTVCFTLNDEEKAPAFLSKLNDTGKVYMTPTVYNGKKGIRAALVNWRTANEDVDLVVKVMMEIAETGF